MQDIRNLATSTHLEWTDRYEAKKIQRVDEIQEVFKREARINGSRTKQHSADHVLALVPKRPFSFAGDSFFFFFFFFWGVRPDWSLFCLLDSPFLFLSVVAYSLFFSLVSPPFYIAAKLSS